MNIKLVSNNFADIRSPMSKHMGFNIDWRDPVDDSDYVIFTDQSCFNSYDGKGQKIAWLIKPMPAKKSPNGIGIVTNSTTIIGIGSRKQDCLFPESTPKKTWLKLSKSRITHGSSACNSIRNFNRNPIKLIPCSPLSSKRPWAKSSNQRATTLRTPPNWALHWNRLIEG